MKIRVYIVLEHIFSGTELPKLFRCDTAGDTRSKAARAMSAVGVRTRQSAGLRGKRSKAIDRKPGKLIHPDKHS